MGFPKVGGAGRGEAASGGGPSPTPVQLQEVVPGADQAPLGLDLGEAPGGGAGGTPGAARRARGWRGAVLHPLGRDDGLDPAGGELPGSGLAPVVGIGEDPPGLPPGIRPGRVDEGQGVGRVGGWSVTVPATITWAFSSTATWAL